MNTIVAVNLTKIAEDEIFNQIPADICTKHKLSKSRYLVSNYGRIFDMSDEEIITLYPTNPPMWLVRSSSNILVPLRINSVLTDTKQVITKYKSISGTTILDRELVMYIRNAYFSKDLTSEEIIKKLNISKFSLGFATGENFIKFENSCETRGNDISMSLEFMEAFTIISSVGPSLKVRTVAKMVCDKMGIEYSSNIYNKAANYYSGRGNYIYIPKNVQRLVE